MTWSWLAVMISLLSWMLAGVGGYSRREFTGTLTALGWLLVGNVALTAAGSLRRERESGVIELMLVSPLSPEQIIGGRLRGIAGQFLPAAVLLFGSWLWLLHALKGTLLNEEHVAQSLIQIGFLSVTLLTLPVTGLYFSLRCRMFIVALFWTAAAGVVVPILTVRSFQRLMDMAPASASFSLLPIWGNTIAVLGALVAVLVWRLRHGGVKGVTGKLLIAVVACAGAAAVTVRAWDTFGNSGGNAAFACILQIALAAWLATRLRRRLEQRNFALPQ